MPGLPLYGKRVLVTRAGTQAETLARALLGKGAEPIVAPAIAIVEPDDPANAERALDELESFAWIVFTSQNGVHAFFKRLQARNADARAIGSARVAAIGDETAERLREHGVSADLVPPVFIGEEVASALIERAQPGERVLIYRAAHARDVLPRTLEDAGLVPTVVAAYKTVFANDPSFAEKVARADVLTFTSASTVRGFCALLGGESAAADAARGKTVACIGRISGQAAVDAGIGVDVVATTSTTTGLLDALEALFTRQS